MSNIKKSVSSVSVLLALLSYIVAVAAAPYQELPPRDGYVPVYIRVGDTPLDDIHPKLAQAFHEIESSNLMLEDDGKSPDENVMALDKIDATSMMNDQIMEESKTAEAIEVNKPTELENKKEDNTVTPAAVEVVTKESDIASFDVVKMDDDAAIAEEEDAEAEEDKRSLEATAEKKLSL